MLWVAWKNDTRNLEVQKRKMKWNEPNKWNKWNEPSFFCSFSLWRFFFLYWSTKKIGINSSNLFFFFFQQTNNNLFIFTFAFTFQQPQLKRLDTQLHFQFHFLTIQTIISSYSFTQFIWPETFFFFFFALQLIFKYDETNKIWWT